MRPILPILALLALGGCASFLDGGHLDCDFMCTPEMAAELYPLTVEAIPYGEVFGVNWTAGVNVDGTTATAHMGRKTKDAAK